MQYSFSVKRQRRELLSNRSCGVQISLFPLLFLSLSCFALLVSRALFIFLSLFYSVAPFIQLNLSPLSLSFSPFFLLSFSFYLSLISFLFSHTHSPARSESLHLSLTSSATRHGVIHTFMVMCHPCFVTCQTFSFTSPAPYLIL